MIALYLQVPTEPVDASTLVAAVRRELEHYARPPFTDASVQTLYVGGGRPSRLSPSALRPLIDACQNSFDAAAPDEITLELHPSDASPDDLEALLGLGVTRLSIGGQSFVDATLRALEAPYSAEDLRGIVRCVQAVGFESVSVDLTFGGPNPSLSTWKASLQRAVNLRVPHVTLHELDADGPSKHGDETPTDWFAYAMTFLDAKGYEPYELTHFARPGHRSRYQEHVYAHGNVLGLGPGAESLWWPDRTDPSTAERWSNVSDVSAYVERLRNNESPVAQREPLDRTALAREYMLLRLRTNEGLALNVLRDRYDCPLRREKSATLNRLATEGLIHDDPARVRLTDRGRRLADAITQRLIREM
ncbi:MAG: coproporphyrinogen-III oxidase family protein [Salinibacter sp.]